MHHRLLPSSFHDCLLYLIPLSSILFFLPPLTSLSSCKQDRQVPQPKTTESFYRARAWSPANSRSKWRNLYVPRFSARPSRSPAGMISLERAWESAARAYMTDCRYTDLQPVGMGAFGLVWYGSDPSPHNGASPRIALVMPFPAWAAPHTDMSLQSL